MKRMNFPGRREIRRDEAHQRAESRAKRSALQQLALLDERLGEGKGARRERARLQAMIDNG